MGRQVWIVMFEHREAELVEGWIAGTSPAMTLLGVAAMAHQRRVLGFFYSADFMKVSASDRSLGVPTCIQTPSMRRP